METPSQDMGDELHTDDGKLKAECQQLQEDSMYTAEAHYIKGNTLAEQSKVLKFLPPFATIISVLAVLLGAPTGVQWVALFTSIITVTILLMDVDKAARDHLSAAKEFTALKHDARALHEAFSSFITAKDFYYEVRRLRDRYKYLAKNTPATDDASLQTARRNIKDGRHTADFTEHTDKA